MHIISWGHQVRRIQNIELVSFSRPFLCTILIFAKHILFPLDLVLACVSLVLMGGGGYRMTQQTISQCIGFAKFFCRLRGLYSGFNIMDFFGIAVFFVSAYSLLSKLTKHLISYIFKLLRNNSFTHASFPLYTVNKVCNVVLHKH